jgi:hypothetical protein
MTDVQIVPIPNTDPPMSLVYRFAETQSLATVADDPLPTGDLWSPMEASIAVAKYPNAWTAPHWSRGDDDRLRWVKDHTGQRAWAGMLFIRDHDSCSGEEVADAVGYENGAQGFKSTLAHLAKRCRQVDRRPMWDVTREDPRSRWSYYLRDDVKALVGSLS